MSWKRATDKNIFGRKHDDLLGRWHSIYSDTASDEVSLQDYLAEIWEAGAIDPTVPGQYLSAPGIERNAISDLIKLKLKADMAWESTLALFDQGRVSWSSIDAHHASVLYAKYVIGICGVYIVRHGETWHLIDVFPDLKSGNRKREKDFHNHTRELHRAVTVVSNNKNKIEQQHIWDIFQRMVRVLNTSQLDQRQQSWVRNFKFKGYQSLRNQVFYTGHYWPRRADLLAALPPTNPMDKLPGIDRFYENIWMNSDERDHVLLYIMREISERLSPEYLKHQILQDSLAA
jgi:hypothetical protein